MPLLACQVEGLDQKCEKMRGREGGVYPSSPSSIPSSSSSALIPLLGIFWQGRRANEAYSEREREEEEEEEETPRGGALP